MDPTGPGGSAAVRDGRLVDLFGARWHLDLGGLREPPAGRVGELWDRATVHDDVDPDEEVPRFVVRRDGDPLVVDGAEHDLEDDALPMRSPRS